MPSCSKHVVYVECRVLCFSHFGGDDETGECLQPLQEQKICSVQRIQRTFQRNIDAIAVQEFEHKRGDVGLYCERSYRQSLLCTMLLEPRRLSEEAGKHGKKIL